MKRVFFLRVPSLFFFRTNIFFSTLQLSVFLYPKFFNLHFSTQSGSYKEDRIGGILGIFKIAYFGIWNSNLPAAWVFLSKLYRFFWIYWEELRIGGLIPFGQIEFSPKPMKIIQICMKLYKSIQKSRDLNVGETAHLFLEASKAFLV